MVKGNKYELRLDIQLSRTVELLERLKAMSQGK